MGAVENIITDNLPIWSSAVQSKSSAGRGTSSKRNLYGIKKLRELILDLAVRGLLVPQDQNDEPASVLLEKIAAEKENLINQKIIRNEKIIISKDIPQLFVLKKGWSWSSLGSLGNIFNGNSINSKIKEEKYSGEEGIPFIATKDVGYGFKSINYSNSVKIPKGEAKFKLAKKNSVFICAEGGSAGKKCGISDQDVFFGNKLFANELYGDINPAFMLACYLSDFFWQQFKGSMTGIIGGISRNKFICLAVPVPPIAEQHRIVAKVDELMALCDTLEQQQEDSIQAHETLVEALLDALTSAVDADAFQAAWQRISEHFDVLFTTEHSIDKLKETILQLAVMGKLVPQDPNDEPASALLEKITFERERFVKEGKMKRGRSFSEIKSEEKSSGFPVSWSSARVSDISIVGTGATPSRSENSYYTPKTFHWVTSGETRSEFIFETNEFVSEKAIKDTNVTVYPIGTLLVAMYGQGKTRGQITELMIEAGTNQACAAIQLIEKCSHHRAYIKLIFKKIYKEIRQLAEGGAQPNLNVGKISNFMLPIPPLAEQQRIVAKVDELMALCDELKDSLQQAQQTQIHLTDAVVENAL